MNARLTLRLAAITLLVVFGANGPAIAQMPDARQMSGIPMPSPDVPAGTIVVRLVRGDISNNITNHAVELQVGGRTLTSMTDESGRATFSGLAAGSDAHAVAVVDGERIESDHLQLAGSTGLRVMLVAGVGAGSGGGAVPPPPAGTPAVEGDVVFGGQSRMHVEFDDDQVEVFYLLEIVNRGSGPVSPTHELVITLPDDAQAPAMLEGSSTQAQVRGRVVSINGPFAPGVTPVQVAYGLSGGQASRVIAQAWPAPWEQVQVLVTKIGNVQVSSEQFSTNNVMPGEGHTFYLGSGPALPAGKELRVALSGLPTRSRAGRIIALALATLVLLGGAWAAYGGQRKSAADLRRSELEARRRSLMADLAKVEQLRRAGSTGDGARLAQRHNDLLAQLERVYGELDEHGAPVDA
jgi:hypothetical protein